MTENEIKEFCDNWLAENSTKLKDEFIAKVSNLKTSDTLATLTLTMLTMISTYVPPMIAAALANTSQENRSL